MKQFIILILVITMVVACKKENKTTVNEVTDEISTSPKTDVIEEVMEGVLKAKQSVASKKAELEAKGFETYNYIDRKTQDTILMQKYFMVFLKQGPIRNQNEEEAKALQEDHQEHLGRMYTEGYADLIGPFADDSDIKGITVYNVPTKKMADSLANLDPMVKAGRLEVEVHPWWSAKGQSLR